MVVEGRRGSHPRRRGVRARRRDEKLHHTPSTTRQSLTGLSLGGGGQVRSTDTTLHQFHRQPALSFICAIRATPFVTFSLVAHLLSRAPILAFSLSLHGLTIVSRDRVRTTLRRNASDDDDDDDDDNDYVLFRNLFLCLATLFFLPFVRCHCHRFRRRREPRPLSCARATRRVIRAPRKIKKGGWRGREEKGERAFASSPHRDPSLSTGVDDVETRQWYSWIQTVA